VWADRPPQRARGTLSSYLTRLRQALAPAGVAITRQPGGYVLAVDPSAVDVHRFHRLLAEARAAGDDAVAEERYARALGLWGGDALANVDTPWLNSMREVLDRQRLTAVLDRNDLALRRGGHSGLLEELSAHATGYPLDERLASQLMLALYRCGRQAEALAVYERVRLLLADELGADPSPPLRHRHQQILTADAALTAPPGPVQAPPDPLPAGPAFVPVPRQLPAPPHAFTGRAAELAALGALLDPDLPGPGAIAAIRGPGGIGKTWLALRWAYDNATRFPDGQLYVDLRGFDPASPPVTPAVAVGAFLHALGVRPPAIPPDTDSRTGLYRTLVAGKRMLIVLDNARDTAQVAPLLPGTGTVLVTSRHRLAGLVTVHGARPLALDVLTDVEARRLLSRHLGGRRMADEPGAVGALLDRCAGLPLALGIVAARVTIDPALSLAALAGQLEAASGRLDALDAGELSANLRAALSCSHRILTPGAARMFGLLGLGSDPDVGLAAVASPADRPATDIRAPAGRQGRHLDALPHDEHALDLYRSTGHRTGQAAALNALGLRHAQLGDHQQAIAYCQVALALSEEIGDRHGQAAAWDSLGYAHHHLGRHQQAAIHYRHALTLVREAGDRYHTTAVLIRLGDTLDAAGAVGSARQAWQHALTIMDELGYPDADQVRARLRRPTSGHSAAA
jgi:DNA-binding SARP family transcriptional activator